MIPYRDLRVPSDPYKDENDEFGDLGDLPALIIDVSQELENTTDICHIDNLTLYENDHVIETVQAFVKKHNLSGSKRPSVVLELVKLVDFKLKQLNQASAIEEF